MQRFCRRLQAARPQIKICDARLYDTVVTQPSPKPTWADVPRLVLSADLASASGPVSELPNTPFCSEVWLATMPRPPHDAKSQSTPAKPVRAVRRS